jgi:hypothetical protein
MVSYLPLAKIVDSSSRRRQPPGQCLPNLLLFDKASVPFVDGYFAMAAFGQKPPREDFMMRNLGKNNLPLMQRVRRSEPHALIERPPQIG